MSILVFCKDCENRRDGICAVTGEPAARKRKRWGCQHYEPSVALMEKRRAAREG